MDRLRQGWFHARDLIALGQPPAHRLVRRRESRPRRSESVETGAVPAPGACKLQFGHGERYQWAYRQLGFSQAATIQVAAGGTTVVDGTCDFYRNHTDEAGQIFLGELEPGDYTLLVVPERLPYGIQWVGRNGGVGSQYKALRIHGESRRVSTVGPIQLDPPATISGTITDAQTGEPLLYAGATVLPSKGLGDPPLGSSCTQWESEGRYSIDTLGPYDWPVRFSPYRDQHAAIWSSGVADRTAVRTSPPRTTQGCGRAIPPP